MRVRRATVGVEILVVGLQAVEYGLDRVFLRVGEQVVSSVYCALKLLARADTRELSDGPCSSIDKTAMCCFSRWVAAPLVAVNFSLFCVGPSICGIEQRLYRAGRAGQA